MAIRRGQTRLHGSDACLGGGAEEDRLVLDDVPELCRVLCEQGGAPSSERPPRRHHEGADRNPCGAHATFLVTVARDAIHVGPPLLQLDQDQDQDQDRSADGARLRSCRPLTLVDELTRPRRVALPAEEQRVIVVGVTARERWVLDGVYGSWLDLVVGRAELVFGLDYPRWFSLQRLVRRTVARAIDESRCVTAPWRLGGMLGRDPIMLWRARYFARRRDRMRAWAADPDAPETVLGRRPADPGALLVAADRPGPPSDP